MEVLPITARLLLARQVAFGVELETDEATGALEAKRPAPVAGGYALTGRDVVAAHGARRGRLVA
jgi:hypothetical protein